MFFSVLLGRSLSCQRIVDEQRRSTAPVTLGAEAATPALATSPSHGDSFTGHRLPQHLCFLCVHLRSADPAEPSSDPDDPVSPDCLEFCGAS